MKLSPQDASNTAWAFAIHGFKHELHLNAVSLYLQTMVKNYLVGTNKRALSETKGQEISNILWALATHNHKPKGLLKLLEEYIVDLFQDDFSVAKIAQVFTRQELANLAFSLSVFGEYPVRLVELIYMGLLGLGDRCDPSYVNKCFGDSGIEHMHVNSLMYLQAIMDLELGEERNHSFCVPENFPTDWTDYPAFQTKTVSDEVDSSSLLDVFTSNTQVSVSKALDRIGFSHVDEHMITMADLVDDYGIKMGACPVALLSLDMADVDSRIGIELDGPGHWVTDVSDSSRLLKNVGHYRTTSKGNFQYVFKWNEYDQEINGSTALKNRLFRAMGWRIINIPFWDWTPIFDDLDKEDEYVKRLIRTNVSKL